MPPTIVQQRKKFGKGSDLRDTETFPPFHDCPDENDLDLRYYSDQGGDPLRHWCFLGEVVQVTYLGRLVCDVKDVQGRMARVAFYDDDRGDSFVQGSPKCKPGYTVAVLYGMGHGFLDMSSGIRVEDNKCVRVSEMQNHPLLTFVKHLADSPLFVGELVFDQ